MVGSPSNVMLMSVNFLFMFLSLMRVFMMIVEWIKSHLLKG
jgi:hypothetical protein